MRPGRKGEARVLIALLAAVAIVLLGAWRFGIAGSELAGGAPITASAAGGGSGQNGNGFSVGGSVTGLFPGASAGLVVTVTNMMPFAIRVTQLSATVGDASAGCAAANLAVGSFTGSRDVPAGGSATVTLPVTMSHAAGDGCQGAHFPLHYSATATRADGSVSLAAAECGPRTIEPCE